MTHVESEQTGVADLDASASESLDVPTASLIGIGQANVRMLLVGALAALMVFLLYRLVLDLDSWGDLLTFNPDETKIEGPREQLSALNDEIIAHDRLISALESQLPVLQDGMLGPAAPDPVGDPELWDDHLEFILDDIYDPNGPWLWISLIKGSDSIAFGAGSSATIQLFGRELSDVILPPLAVIQGRELSDEIKLQLDWNTTVLKTFEVDGIPFPSGYPNDPEFDFQQYSSSEFNDVVSAKLTAAWKELFEDSAQTRVVWRRMQEIFDNTRDVIEGKSREVTEDRDAIKKKSDDLLIGIATNQTIFWSMVAQRMLFTVFLITVLFFLLKNLAIDAKAVRLAHREARRAQFLWACTNDRDKGAFRQAIAASLREEEGDGKTEADFSNPLVEDLTRLVRSLASALEKSGKS